MERVLIVARTHMKNGACIGGLVLSTNRSVRLLSQDGSNLQTSTTFNVGEVWELEFNKPDRIESPHIEDVFVTGQRLIGKQSNLREALMQRVRPWRGSPEQLYDGLLVIKCTTGYVCRSNGVPNCSTGYWLPDKQLTLVYRGDKLYYKYPFGDEADWYNEALAIKYVGYADPIPRIPAHTLVRVSLARWFRPQGVSESKCYLQISGWYL